MVLLRRSLITRYLFQVKNHNIIVGGYANGFVGLWDIREEDNLTKFCNDGVQCFVPISFFNTIGHAVTGKYDIQY